MFYLLLPLCEVALCSMMITYSRISVITTDQDCGHHYWSISQLWFRVRLIPIRTIQRLKYESSHTSYRNSDASYS